jgi:phage baseplate assembly protein gpV
MYDFIPHMILHSTSGGSLFQEQLSDNSLRVGVITKAYPPDDDKNQSKQFWEYDVKIDTNVGQGFGEVILHHVKVMDMFGGISDTMRWTPRVSSEKANTDPTGSKVLVLCVNDSRLSAYIIGGVPNSVSTEKDESEHKFKLKFNGAKFEINNEGELILTFGGATDNQDKTESSNGGSFIKLAEDGSIVLSDKSDNLIKVDHGSQIFKTETSGGVLLGGSKATHPLILSNTYRAQETTMHTQLSAQLKVLVGLVGGLAGAVTALTAPAAGLPPTSYPAFGVIAGILGTIAGNLAAMGIAIDAFETAGPTYLSLKNKTE